MAYLIGIDCAGIGTKMLLTCVNGTLATPQPGWAALNTDDFWKKTCESIQAVLAKSQIKFVEIKGVSLGPFASELAPILRTNRNGICLDMVFEYPSIGWTEILIPSGLTPTLRTDQSGTCLSSFLGVPSIGLIEFPKRLSMLLGHAHEFT